MCHKHYNKTAAYRHIKKARQYNMKSTCGKKCPKLQTCEGDKTCQRLIITMIGYDKICCAMLFDINHS